MAPSSTIRVEVKRSVSLPFEKNEIVNLKPGVQVVDKRVLDHWLFKALVKDGEATVVTEKAPAAPPTPDEIQKAVEGALLIAHGLWEKEQNDLIDLLKADFEKEKSEAIQKAVEGAKAPTEETIRNRINAAVAEALANAKKK